jgi:hypothetical protein
LREKDGLSALRTSTDPDPHGEERRASDASRTTRPARPPQRIPVASILRDAASPLLRMRR